jgi:deferrochelatase/peroxidase EfeB
VTEHDAPSGVPASGRFSRRAFLGAGLGGLAVGALGGAGGAAWAGSDGAGSPGAAPSDGLPSTTAYPFYDQPHQGGVATPQQHHAIFVSYDLTTTDPADLQVLLARWSAAAAQLQRGRSLGAVEPSHANAVPTDTGEAADLGPSGLTVTIGLGPGVFDDRFGLARFKPAKLDHLPVLPSDQLDPKLTGGDLSIQACAEDPQVAYHAVRDLSRMARGTAVVRWTVMGFGRASAGKGQTTPRNLMGFKDGTRNIKDDADFERFVWHSGADQAWMKGGTYQVARKIQMHIENWDTDQIGDQQAVFGRTKQEGAPLSGAHEFDAPDFARKGDDGELAIPARSHVALAAHENNGGLKILRRSYNFTDGMNADGQIDAGLLFVAYMNDPAAFVTLQTKLGRVDRLNEYIAHVGSAVFAVPPAPASGSYVGEALFR